LLKKIIKDVKIIKEISHGKGTFLILDNNCEESLNFGLTIRFEEKRRE